MKETKTGCLRCDNDYKVDLDSAGYPLHPHYCNDCCKQCQNCGKWFIITNFLPIVESQTYQDWIASKASVHDNPLGLLMGRHCVEDLCIGCKPFRDPIPSSRVDPDQSLEDALSRLQELLS